MMTQTIFVSMMIWFFLAAITAIAAGLFFKAVRRDEM